MLYGNTDILKRNTVWSRLLLEYLFLQSFFLSMSQLFYLFGYLKMCVNLVYFDIAGISEGLDEESYAWNILFYMTIGYSLDFSQKKHLATQKQAWSLEELFSC